MPEPHILPTVERLHQLFEEKEPGVLYWKTAGRHGRPKAGSLAGCANPDGYFLIRIGGYGYYRHRLIWKLHKRVDPLGIVHHINEIPGNDWIDNLKDVTYSENNRNNESFIGLTYGNRATADITQILTLNFDLWADEDGNTLQQRLNELISPILQEVLNSRMGRKRVR